MAMQLLCGYQDGMAIYALLDEGDYYRLRGLSWSVRHRANGNIQNVSRWVGKDEQILLHHEVVGKPPKGFVVDHIDRNPLNNTKANLRIVTQRVNARNNGKGNGDGVSANGNGFKGSVSKTFRTHQEAAEWVRKVLDLTDRGLI